MKFWLSLKYHFLAVLIFPILSLTLIISWFRFGFIYGGGDVGLQTYNPPRIVEIAKYIWWEATAPGSPTPQGLTAIPFNLMFSPLKWVGFNPLMLQVSLFFPILLLMGLGMYFLILFLFGKDCKKYAILAAVFYMLNPYMMIQVWHRFVHSTFFISAALPFMIIFWIKWVREGKISAILTCLLINLLALYGFGTIAYILTLWLLLLIITISEVVFPWTGLAKAKKVVALFLIGFLLWGLTNSWWMIPIFKIAPSFLSEQHSDEQTLVTFYTLGQQTVLPYSLQMINPFYLFYQLDFGTSYQHILIRMIPWIFVVIIFIGVIRGIFNAKTARWPVIYLLVLILSKGAASPFSYFYIFGMKHSFSLGVLRNPFEKIGVLLPVVSSILLVIGTKIVFEFLRKKMDSKYAKLGIVTTYLLIFSFSWPLFSGQIFGRIDKRGFVEVPKSYNEADLWIKSDYSKNANSNPGKILHLPLTTGESITYKWEHGYSGLEPSPLLFTSMPSISHGFNIKQVDNSLSSLYQVFHEPSLTPKTILRLLRDFNVRYIVLHKDTKWEGGEFYSPDQTERVLNNLDFLESSQKFGELVVYKVADGYFRPKISLTGNFDWIYPPFSPSLWPWILSEDRTLITDLENQKKESVDTLSTNTLIFPKTSFIYTEASSSSTLQLITTLVSNPNLDRLWLDPLQRLKKIYRTNNEVQKEEINDKLISASSKILRVLRTTFVENKPIPPLLDEYLDEMKDILSSNSAVVSYYARDKTISNIFQTHLYMLRVIANKIQSEKVVKIGDSLKRDLIKNNFISLYYQEGQSSDLLEKTVLKFEISRDSDYDLVLTSPKGRDLYQDKIRSITTIIDGKTDYLIGTKIDNFISLGQINLTAGTHEIVLPALYSDNLVIPTEGNVILENAAFLDNSTIKIDSIGKVNYFENKIDYVQGLDIYQISFSAKVDRGNGFYIQLVQDTDTQVNGQVNHQVNEFISQTPEQDWRNYNFPLPTLRSTTKNAAIRFLTVPAQNSALIKDLQVFRLFNEDIMLRKVGKSGQAHESNVLINQKSPVFYEGKFHLDKPSLLIFSESYHPSWKLTLLKDGQRSIVDDQFLANLYSNAWFIKGEGDYDFKLEFEPQKMVNFGIMIALITYGGLVLFGIVSYFFKIK